MKKKIYFLSILFTLILFVQNSYSQTFTLSGDNFEERSESLINSMIYNINPYDTKVNIKYSAPFFWARIDKGIDADRAIVKLEELYDNILANPSAIINSDIEFYAHQTMHGYLLCKDKLPISLKNKIKSYLQTVDFNSPGSVGTLNLDMQRYAVGLMVAYEWPDFKDLNGKNSTQIIAYNRPRILHNLDIIFHNNSKEVDAFVYMPTDLMYIRMLAEFSDDAEVKNRSYVVFQQMIASLIGPWNQGLYIANPTRAKGWNQLVNGSKGMNMRIAALSWLYFGNRSNTFLMANQYYSDTNNYPSLCYWMAYKRSISPLKAILDVEKLKTFPYEYKSFVDDIRVDRNNEEVKNWKLYKYTYQSINYGLATETAVPYDIAKADYTYAYKEAKRTYLAWQDESTERCLFTVCQDNPERPGDTVKANAACYGENPHHRTLQYKNAAIGITNVPTSYINGKRYQLYVPFTRLGIKLRVESDNWVFCHTGSMMFAFRTIEPFTMHTSNLPYVVDKCDLLMFADPSTRKGSWILQTTEITDDLKGSTMQEEINKFKVKILNNTLIETIDYDTDFPRVKYTSLDGDTIDLTYFPPTSVYSDQHKINGNIQALDDEYIFNCSYVKQSYKSDSLYIYNNSTPTILNWNDPAPGGTLVNRKVYVKLSDDSAAWSSVFEDKNNVKITLPNNSTDLYSNLLPYIRENDEVWIAKGKYTNTAKLILNNIKVYGGFDGTERNIDERKLYDADRNGIIESWEFENETNFKGLGNSLTQASNFQIIQLTGNTLLDGIAISDHFFNGGSSTTYAAGGTVNIGSTIKNCIIRDITTYSLGGIVGGGLYIAGGHVENCLFESCTAIGNETSTNTCYGSAILIYGIADNVAGTPQGYIKNSMIRNCRAGIGTNNGRGSIFAKGGAIIENCVIYNNTASTCGAGFYFHGSGDTNKHVNRIIGCTVVNNCSSYSSFPECTYAEIYNTIFWGNANTNAPLTNGSSYNYNIRLKASTLNAFPFLDAIAYNGSIQYSDQNKNASFTPIMIGGAINDPSASANADFNNPTTFIGVAKNVSEFDMIRSSNFTLKNTSPLIDLGLEQPSNKLIGSTEASSEVVFSNTDALGNLRTASGNGDGSRYYDLGAYECVTKTQKSAINESDTATSNYNIYINNGLLQIEGITSNTLLSIYGINGKLIFSSSINDPTFSLPLVSKGLYFINLKSPNNTYTKKIYY